MKKIIFLSLIFLYTANATQYVYHIKPANMIGSVLYPLNKLKDIHPDIYTEEAKKYIGREKLMRRIIPLWNCLWNDIIFACPLHPHYIYIEYTKALQQYWPESLTKELEFYKIPIEKLNSCQCGIFFNLNQHYAHLDLNNYRELEQVPEQTKKQFAEDFSKKEIPFLFLNIPHILINGEIDISDVEVIKWTQAIT